jgi:hypothetical protein
MRFPIPAGVLTLLAVTTNPVTAAEMAPTDLTRAFLRDCYAGREKRKYLAPSTAHTGCLMMAAERWKIVRTRTRGSRAVVEVDAWNWYRQDCDWSERYYPARRVRLTFRAERENGQWHLTEGVPLMKRSDALRFRQQPFYLVIAGSFRTPYAARKQAAAVTAALDEDGSPNVYRSDHQRGLRPGWYVSVPPGGECTTRHEAGTLRRRLAQAGVPCYIRRIL